MSLGLRTAAGLLVALGLALELGRTWPDWIPYYNPSSGGPFAAYRHFVDSNSDYGKLHDEVARELDARSSPPQRLVPSSGPRSGYVAIAWTRILHPDPHERTRPAAHWLDAFEPADHARGKFWLYRLSVEDFARHAERSGTPTARLDLARVLAAEGRLGEAQAELEDLTIEQRRPLIRLLAALRAAPRHSETPLRQARQWHLAGRNDLVLQVLEQRADAQAAFLRARALGRLQRGEEALTELRPFAAGRLEGGLEVDLLLAQLLLDLTHVQDAIDVLRTAREVHGTHPLLDQLLAQAEDRAERARPYLQALRSPGTSTHPGADE